jgi:hypothetical protein
MQVFSQWCVEKNSSFGFLAWYFVLAKNQMYYLCGGFPFQYFLVANLPFCLVSPACA